MAVGKIAVLGGGQGSLGTAGDLALRGFEVHYWGRNPRKLASLFKFKQIRLVGAMEGVAPLADASDDLARTLKGARLVVVALPGFAQRDVATQCAPFVENGQIFLVCGNSGMGSYEFSRIFRENGVDKDFLCAEWSGIPAGGRIVDSDVVNVSMNLAFQIKTYSSRVGVFPAKRTDEAMEIVHQVYAGVANAENSLACSLSIRAIIHQAVAMLMSASAIDHFGYWDIMAEGHSPTALKLIKAVDDERKSIMKAWGYQPTEVYGAGHLTGENLDTEKPVGASQTTVTAFRVRSAWKDRLDMHHRYVTEAIPYGYVLRSSLAEKVGIDVPMTDALIRIFSTINGQDYSKAGRSLHSLGLESMRAEELDRFLWHGGAP